MRRNRTEIDHPIHRVFVPPPRVVIVTAERKRREATRIPHSARTVDTQTHITHPGACAPVDASHRLRGARSRDSAPSRRHPPSAATAPPVAVPFVSVESPPPPQAPMFALPKSREQFMQLVAVSVIRSVIDAARELRLQLLRDARLRDASEGAGFACVLALVAPVRVGRRSRR